ncbi:CinA family protein [Micavibrio aeruginosavorus]|uniref:Competence/damage-inducible CinA C-terminal domain protein n=1 Tax=Micavibrio aeruginosavorus (strain ARL-13) TaxID=856793 RepID=G2KSK9_MICAA|nr:CinA family protein [Micavibrio aeruginosavorus]AEP09609.1 competence/damage-inducible CinA C-terminal domain protein [Micavibrio aeruginosavorus ARL-13]
MLELLEAVSARLVQKKLMLVSAESCTGGMIGAVMTDRPGSSAFYAGGFITYSNDLKTRLLDVPEPMLAQYGAVSAAVAQAMAQGALDKTNADIAISVTGIAGPDGGSVDKPVGLVYIGYGLKGRPINVSKYNFEGDRGAIRRQTVAAALDHILKTIEVLE